MTHLHHIIPKHEGGTNNKENLIEVTVEEHALLHYNLWKKNGNEYDKIAWLALSKQIGKEEIIKQVASIIGKSNKGRKRSEETKQKMRKPHPFQNTSHLKNQSLETRKKNSEWHKGKTVLKGRKWYNNGVKSTLSYTQPEGYSIGNLIKNRKWYNNGIKSIMAFSAPLGFVEGRLYMKGRKCSQK